MSRARSLSLLANENALSVVSSTLDVGVGKTNPSADFMVGAGITMDGTAGVITATKYVGDGADLTGISASGIGTPVSTDTSSVLNKVYYTNQILTIPASVSVDVPSSAHVAYIQAAEVAVDSGADLTIADGDDFLTDALGIGSTGTAAALSGGGGRVRADNYTDRAATGAPTFTNGLQVTGVVTATTGSFSGAVSVGGTLTYEDVTNIDSVGIITARLGIDVQGGLGVTCADNVRLYCGNDGDLSIYHSTNSIITNSTGSLLVDSDSLVLRSRTGGESYLIADVGAATTLFYDNSAKLETTTAGAITTGIHTVTVGTDLEGFKVEEGKYDTDALNGEFDFDLENGHVQTHTGSTAGTYFPDFRVGSSRSLSSVMDVGDVISATLIVAASNTAHYCTAGVKIDNSTTNVTVEWIGSSAPTAGKGAGFDIYAFTIQKTAATPAYLVIINATDAG